MSYKFYYDFEFLDNGLTIEPISLGMVEETGKFELYLINTDFNGWDEDDWLELYVKPNLKTLIPKNCGVFNHYEPMHTWDDIIYQWIESFDQPKIELVGYYADYDHVCMAHLFGRMSAYPQNFPQYTTDIKQWLHDVGDPVIPFTPEIPHNSLSDARWNRDVHIWLQENYNHPAWHWNIKP